MCVELRPSGHAVNVNLHAGLREGFEFCPAPLGDCCITVVKRKVPTLEIRAGRRSGRQHGEIAGQMLARWYALSTGLRPAAAKTARDWRSSHNVLFLALSQMNSTPKE